MQRVYISGPIGGHDIDERRNAFNKVRMRLTQRDIDSVNPMEVQPCADFSCLERGDAVGPGLHEYFCYMRHDIKAMMDCDIIALMPGWTESKGAMIEYRLAEELGFTIWHVNEEGEIEDER